MDFGSSGSKRITDVMLHAKCEGTMKVTIECGGVAGYASTSVPASIDVRGHKTNMPRGIKGRNFACKVENENGINFDLMDIELVTESSNSRYGR